jgi:hypothetical protein
LFDVNKIINDAEQVKKFMDERQMSFIRNNERIRKQLDMNLHQLARALKYLVKNGFLEQWNKKLFHISQNSN